MRSITSIVSCIPATIISAVPLDVKLMQRRSCIASCLQTINRQQSALRRRTISWELPYMPYCWPPSLRHMNVIRSECNHAFVVDENLSYGSVRGRVCFEGGVALELTAHKRSNAALKSCQMDLSQLKFALAVVQSHFQSIVAPATCQTSSSLLAWGSRVALAAERGSAQPARRSMVSV